MIYIYKLLTAFPPKHPTRRLKKKRIKIQTNPDAFMPPPPLSDQLICKFFEGILNNYIDIQQKNIQVRIVMLSHEDAYNSLSHSALHLQSLEY